MQNHNHMTADHGKKMYLKLALMALLDRKSVV